MSITLPKLLTNKTKNGYVVLIYKNAWDPKLQMSKRILGRSIGKIMSTDGLGEVILNDKFLNENPQWRDYIITKIGRGQYKVDRREAVVEKLERLEAEGLKAIEG